MRAINPFSSRPVRAKFLRPREFQKHHENEASSTIEHYFPQKMERKGVHSACRGSLRRRARASASPRATPASATSWHPEPYSKFMHCHESARSSTMLFPICQKAGPDNAFEEVSAPHLDGPFHLLQSLGGGCFEECYL